MPFRAETVTLLLPELSLIAAGTLILLGGAFWPARGTWTTMAALAIVAASLALVPTGGSFLTAAWEVVEGPVLVDWLAITGRGLAILSGLALVLANARRASDLQGGELPGLLLMLTAGTSLACWAGNLVLLFLALELISIPSYVVLFLGRSSRRSTESTVKYFLLSVLSAAIFLLGLMLLYGVTGTVDLARMAAQMNALDGSQSTVLVIAMLLLFAGLSFKLTVVPLHFYAPDVYQTTSHINAALLAILPKLAGLVVLLRLLSFSQAAGSALGWMLVALVAMITMTVGNVTALWQRDLRRMLAYSSIAHGGYLLVGVAAGLMPPPATAFWFDGYSSALFYWIVYAAATMGVFAVWEELSHGERPVTRIDDLGGLWWRSPVLAIALAISLFSLTGIPPLAGFWGKLVLISGALQAAGEASERVQTQWLLALAVVAMVNAAIGATYYLRVVAASFFFESAPSPPRVRSGIGMAGLVGCLAALICLGLGLWPGPAVRHTRQVGSALTRAVPEHPAPGDSAALRPVARPGPRSAGVP